MRIIGHQEIIELNVNPAVMWDWVDTALKHKEDVLLPAKISIDAGQDRFYNTMPVIMPSLGIGGVKIVNRYPTRQPALSSKILLYSLQTGDVEALLDGTYITCMRTGAVATHSADILAVPDYKKVVFIGLGNTARATLLVLANRHPEREFEIRLIKYKDQHESFAHRFKEYKNLHFSFYDDFATAVADAEVAFSAVTVFHEDICPPEAFPPGITIIPIHTRGFMECDKVFDKVFGDDYKAVSHFKYFNQFASFAEVAQVITSKKPGRENSQERILAYNIGIALHDFYFAKKLMELIGPGNNDIDISEPKDKFWC